MGKEIKLEDIFGEKKKKELFNFMMNQITDRITLDTYIISISGI